MRILQAFLIMAVLLAAPVHSVLAQDAKRSLIIQVDGLSCPFCAYGLEKNLNKVDGIDSVHMDMKSGKATVLLKPDAHVDDQVLRKAVEKAGFTAREIKRH